MQVARIAQQQQQRQHAQEDDAHHPERLDERQHHRLLLHHAVNRAQRLARGVAARVEPCIWNHSAGRAASCAGAKIDGRDVADQLVLVHLAAARQEGRHGGDAEAAADIAHQVVDAGGVAHLLFAMPDMLTAISGMNRNAMATPWITCGQKMSQ